MTLSKRYRKTIEHLEQIQNLWPMEVIKTELQMIMEEQLISDVVELCGKYIYTLNLLGKQYKGDTE